MKQYNMIKKKKKQATRVIHRKKQLQQTQRPENTANVHRIETLHNPAIEQTATTTHSPENTANVHRIETLPNPAINADYDHIDYKRKITPRKSNESKHEISVFRNETKKKKRKNPDAIRTCFQWGYHDRLRGQT